MKRYFVRSVKYLVALVVLYVGLMAVMHYSQHSTITFAERWQLMFAQEPMRSWGPLIQLYCQSVEKIIMTVSKDKS